MAVLVVLQPLACVTRTGSLPEALTSTDCVVAPFDQSHDRLSCRLRRVAT